LYWCAALIAIEVSPVKFAKAYRLETQDGSSQETIVGMTAADL
jgi:hypothetical protein